MPPKHESLEQQYQDLTSLKKEFDLAMAQKDLTQAQRLKTQLEQQRDQLQAKLWLFENLSKEQFKQQYDQQMELCKEHNLLTKLSNNQEGLKDQQGREYPLPTFQEITTLLKSQELFQEKIATFQNPLILITPFALTPQKLKDSFNQQIEQHFVEVKTEDNTRIPDPDQTKLRGKE